MLVPSEFLLPALKRKVTASIIPAPPGKRVFRQCGTQRIVADENPSGKRKYGIVNVTGARYKQVEKLTDEDVRAAGHNSIKSFISWWGSRYPGYNPEDRVAIIEFELVAVEKFGLRLMEGKIKAGDKRGKER
jgi:hypothetical protein